LVYIRGKAKGSSSSGDEHAERTEWCKAYICCDVGISLEVIDRGQPERFRILTSSGDRRESWLFSLRRGDETYLGLSRQLAVLQLEHAQRAHRISNEQLAIRQRDERCRKVGRRPLGLLCGPRRGRDIVVNDLEGQQQEFDRSQPVRSRKRERRMEMRRLRRTLELTLATNPSPPNPLIA
jgi:hypothetical protein